MMKTRYKNILNSRINMKIYLNFLLVIWHRIIVWIGSLFTLSFFCNFIPIKIGVLFISFFLETLFEEWLTIIIIRLFIETKISAVSYILDKFIRESFTEDFNSSWKFLFHNSFVFIFLVVCFQILPW